MPFAKGPSQKNRDVSWRVSAASLVNGAPFYYTHEHHPSTILISPSLSPRAAYGSSLFLSLSLQQDKQVQALSTLSRISITRRRVHARPKCSKRFSFGSNLFRFPSRMKGYGIVRNLDTEDVSIHMTTHYFLIIFPRVLFLFPLFHCILSQNVSINEIHLLSNNW